MRCYCLYSMQCFCFIEQSVVVYIMKPSLNVIGTEIRRFRNEVGLTQAELGNKCGVTHSYISLIERGGCNPARETFNAIIRAMSIERLNNA